MKIRYSSIYVFCIFIFVFGLLSLGSFLADGTSEGDGSDLSTFAFDRNRIEAFEDQYTSLFAGRDRWLALGKDIELMKGIKNDEIQIVSYQGVNVSQATEEISRNIGTANLASALQIEIKAQVDKAKDWEDEELAGLRVERDLAASENQRGEADSESESNGINEMEVQSTGTTTDSADMEQPPEETEADQPIEGMQGSDWGQILIYKGSAMEINYFDPLAAEHYAVSINAYAEVFPDVSIYSMLVPTPIEFIDNELYKSASTPQKSSIAATNRHFLEQVKPVDIYEAMHAHRNEYLYFRTDHHWTQRGAYYAFQVFAAMLGETAPDIETYEYQVETGYLGSLYRISRNKSLAENPDEVETFLPLTPHVLKGVETQIPYNTGAVLVEKYLELEDKYGVFLGGDRSIVSIETENKNGRRILVLKDSYGNAFAPFLVDVAERVVVVDPRHFAGNIQDVVSEYEITDILFLNYALITGWDGYGQLYGQLLKNP